MPLRSHILQHVPFETPGVLLESLKRKGPVSFTRFFRNEPLPELDAFDFLLIMGGPMSVHDEQKFNWLVNEKRFIEESIVQGKQVVGICLGAQLIADVLGAQVLKNRFKEIGWFEVQRSPGAEGTFLADTWPTEIMAFHWHGETFDLPDGTVRLAFSEACENQGFVFENRVLGLQFHLEVTPTIIDSLLENCADELDGGPFVQDPEKIRAGQIWFSQANQLINQVVNKITG